MKRKNDINNHSREARLKLAYEYSNYCKVLQEQGFEVSIAIISIFKEIHALNRIQLKNYFEFYLKKTITEIKKEIKNQYTQILKKELKNVAGLDLIIYIIVSFYFLTNIVMDYHVKI